MDLGNIEENFYEIKVLENVWNRLNVKCFVGLQVQAFAN